MKLIIGGVGAVLMMVLIFITFCIIKPSTSIFIAIFKRKTADDKNVEVFIMKYGSLGMKRYNYADIKKITNSFHVKLGQGSFGTVFKGKLSDGRPVAVKVLNTSKASGQEFINEVASIGRTSHVNIVTLLGFSFDHKKRALIYEYMPNGSLEKYIYRHVPLKTSENLGVEKLYEIALGIARGLDYLHRGCNTRILHLDIKPHNILLDEDFCPKIAGFGLAKLYSRKESIVSMLEARGTIGYIAPEVFNRNFGGVSHKSDVYSYGMLILEMVGGRKNVDVAVGSGNTSEIYFPYWVYNRLKKDEILLDGATTIEENDYARKMTIVGLWCIQANPVQRPSTSKVIEMLEGSMEELEMPPKPFFSSPPRSPITTFNISQEESQDHCSSTKNVPTWSLVSPSLNFFIYATYIINQLVEVVLSTISKTMAGPPFLFPLLPLLFPCLFISIAAQSNPTCPSSEFCGEISIKYPFWKIDDDQTQHCGYQGFGINCSTINGTDHPMMKIGNNSYYVRQIIYDVQRVILVDDYVSPIEIVSQPNRNSCPTVRDNIDFHSLPLNFTEYNVNLSFHFNCNGIPNFATELPCPESNSGGRKSCVNVMSPETEDFDWSSYSCTEDVVKTVMNNSDLYADRLGREYGLALSRGFELKWGSLETCSKCEKSDGRCGYNNSTQESMCFCRDGRTTTDHCNRVSISIFTAMPLLIIIFTVRLNCSVDEERGRVSYFQNGSTALGQDTCENNIIVPVLENRFDEFMESEMMPLAELLKEGFPVEYKGSNPTGDISEIFILDLVLWAGFGAGTDLKRKLIIGFLGAVLMMVLIFITFCIIKPSTSNFIAIFKRKTEDDKNVEVFIMKYGSLGMKRYNYADIKKITNSFHVKLGQGGFGTVFKGKLSDGRPVAVKVLNTSKASGQEFINEVASIGRTSHVNIVTLLGFSFDHKKRALIYEYMPNGSLEKYIYRHVPLKTSENLGVEKLYEVALGIARGLDYLHRGCNTRILHLDIKPHNILLDEDFCPKIADFGLAKLYSRKESIVSMLEARGTIGYIAPEVFNRNFGGVSHKSDVYSYGMLILEMVGGRKNVDVAVGSGNTSEIYFPYWVYNRLKKDEILLDGVTTIEENDYARKMTIVGLWCIQANPVQRPSTSKVIEMLEGSMEELEMPPKPFFSSPPRSPITTFNISQEESQDHCSSTSNKMPHV
ncbi:hypothetical protein OSB04_014722 [Centaurea solstitialis]|uniref:non-specific serine/threonine protein kinase n=1 Tax=Centaurea solstitialis TaxID=347529 RepID=A0AA38TFX0_9ASTR|nr:hypothetical protein OSB04_014722 [Centaurea solstitialis]